MERNTMKTARNTVLVIILALALASCSSTGKLYPSGADQDYVTNHYKLLHAEAMTVDATLTTLGAFYKAGKLSEDIKNRAVEAHAQFQVEFDKAVAALVLYYNSPTDSNKSSATNTFVQTQVSVAAITAISILSVK